MDVNTIKQRFRRQPIALRRAFSCTGSNISQNKFHRTLFYVAVAISHWRYLHSKCLPHQPLAYREPSYCYCQGCCCSCCCCSPLPQPQRKTKSPLHYFGETIGPNPTFSTRCLPCSFQFQKFLDEYSSRPFMDLGFGRFFRCNQFFDPQTTCRAWSF